MPRSYTLKRSNLGAKGAGPEGRRCLDEVAPTKWAAPGGLPWPRGSAPGPDESEHPRLLVTHGCGWFPAAKIRGSRRP